MSKTNTPSVQEMRSLANNLPEENKVAEEPHAQLPKKRKPAPPDTTDYEAIVELVKRSDVYQQMIDKTIVLEDQIEFLRDSAFKEIFGLDFVREKLKTKKQNTLFLRRLNKAVKASLDESEEPEVEA